MSRDININNKNINKIVEEISNMTQDEIFYLKNEIIKRFKLEGISFSSNNNSKENEEESEKESKLKSLYIKDVSEEKDKKIATARVLTKIIGMNLIKCIKALEKSSLPLLIKEDLKEEEITSLKDLFKEIEGIVFEEK